MRQKYVISVDKSQKTLLIKEYADIGRNRKYETPEMVAKRRFSFLCEESYDSDVIVKSISRGKKDLVATLRTRNLFPIMPLADQIADSVVALYRKKPADGSVVLVFDDADPETE